MSDGPMVMVLNELWLDTYMSASIFGHVILIKNNYSQKFYMTTPAFSTPY